ncbi:MAG: glycosyltransferase family 39 protein, partial [Chloroflexota bacterium]
MVNPPLLVYVLGLAFWPWTLISPASATEDWVSQAIVFGRLWSVFFGVLTVALTYRVGKRAGAIKTGLAAMVLMAGTFLPARESHFGVNDALVTFLVLLVIDAGLRLFSSHRWPVYAAAGIAVGLTAAAKLTGGLAALVLLAAYWLAGTAHKNRHPRLLFLAGAIALLTFFLVTFPLWLTPQVVVADVIEHLEFGAEGYKGARMVPSNGWQFYAGVLGWGMGWLLLFSAVISLISGIRQRRSVETVLAIFPIVLFGVMGGQKILFARFILPAIPPLVVLAALGLATWQERWLFWRRHQVFVWPLLMGVVLAQPLVNLIWFDHLLTRPDTRQLATDWVKQELPEKTIITSESYAVFPKNYFFTPDNPYKLMFINERSTTNDNLDHYLWRTAQFVVLSNYTFGRARLDPADEALRLAQLAYLDEQATLVKTFNPYRPGYEAGWFYQDEIYGPAGETLQRVLPGPLIKIYKIRPPALDQLNISVPLRANLSNQLYLLGYDLPQTQVKAGQALPITFYWQAPAEKSPEADFIQFNRLLDSNGNLRGSIDREPREYYSTHLWNPGEIVIDGAVVPVQADAPPGQYYLNVGYYLV